MSTPADSHPTEAPSLIRVPDLLAEQTGLQGFAFSHKLLREPDAIRLSNPRTPEDLQAVKDIARNARVFAEKSDGGPGVGENYIRIRISNAHDNAGSRTDHLLLYFGGRDKYLRLWGLSREGERFPRGRTLTWDINGDATDPPDWIETVPTDAWDDVLLVNPSGDGLLIEKITLVHSSITLVDWPPAGAPVWLDGSKREKHGIIGLADQILATKLTTMAADIRWVPQLHHAVRELGKTDGTKYGTRDAWCSEFASWCLRKAGWWDAPKPASLADNINSANMEAYFRDKDRMFTRDQLLAGDYELTMGDYLRFNNHSALFVRYLSDGRATTDERKRFESIDGNNGSRVRFASGDSREIRDLISVGSTR